MKKITIKALTHAGDQALRANHKEFLALPRFQKMVFNPMYSYEVTDTDKYTVVLIIKGNSVANNPYAYKGVLHEIKKALKDNGAKKDKDFIITEE
jgi:hypothetical protein